MLRVACLTLIGTTGAFAAPDDQAVALETSVREKCLEILRRGLHGDDFWPSMHAAEGLTRAGYPTEVTEHLAPRLPGERDDQRRCGIARELVRAGDRSRTDVLLQILASDEPHGHVHAAESLYKVSDVGDGRTLRQRFTRTNDIRLKLMSAAALARCGNPQALAFLRESLGSDQADVVRLAAWVLARVGDRSDVDRLRPCLDDATGLDRAFIEHSLATLGDADGRGALIRNLSSDDASVRTFAATFAGDVRVKEAIPALTQMLDDSHADAAIRAAQTLLSLAARATNDRTEDVSQLVFPASTAHPRYTEGSILELRNGNLLFAVTEFLQGGSDFSAAHIVARESPDGGRTWGAARVIQENTGGLNVMSVTLRRLTPERIAMFYLKKNSHSDLDLMVRFSEDEGRTFQSPVLITRDDGYHVVNNDRVTRLASGRLLAPAASTADVQKVNHFVSACYLSDDNGRTWRRSQGHVDAPQRGAMEPEVIELRDGRVLMIVRTQLGLIGKSLSTDGGETWSSMESLGLRAPEAPATLRRVPSTGDLMLIWNDTFTPGAGHGGRRTPLTVAISADEGSTWRKVGTLESDKQRTFSYPSLAFIKDRAVMSYWESGVGRQLSCRFRSVPVSWLYTR